MYVKLFENLWILSILSIPYIVVNNAKVLLHQSTLAGEQSLKHFLNVDTVIWLSTLNRY